MKKLCLFIGLLGTLEFAQASDGWDKVYSEPGKTWFIHVPSIERKGEYLSIWHKVEDKNGDWVMLKSKIDCVRDRVIMASFYALSIDGKETGGILQSDDEINMIPITSGSWFSILKRLCYS